jgi:hypothetical protein
MDAMRPAGVTNRVSRIAVPNEAFASDADAEAEAPAVDRVMA